MIPLIDIAALFGADSPARRAADAAIMAAAADAGFMTVTGFDALAAPPPSALLRIFSLPEAEKRRLWRQTFAPDHANVYRGWFPLQPGSATWKEGIDMGPDIAGPARAGAEDPLLEPTPLPEEAALPGWRAQAAAYYRAMETAGQALMRALARGLDLPEGFFDAAFAGGISTLRLIRYPERPAESLDGVAEDKMWVSHQGRRMYLVGAPHVDSGFVTLLAQDGVEGLQARAHSGEWITVPPAPGTLAVNFGKLLETWSGGRIRATEHRVVGAGRERHSVPFFYEPRVDALIAPLPGRAAFPPVLYGDHLWALMTRFIEFRGLEALRPPRRIAS
ncbi:MAG TPA: 2OG-Fe(II) oxygenase family protein [Acetobacteraceae bacterium]|nr:2OG-Fe(II) oxygenase family protein [Acetobacteraceae bacterium]